MTNKLLESIKRARPGSFIDIRIDRDGVGCVDSFAVEELWELLPSESTSRAWLTYDPLPLDCQCSPDGLCDKHRNESVAVGE